MGRSVCPTGRAACIGHVGEFQRPVPLSQHRDGVGGSGDTLPPSVQCESDGHAESGQHDAHLRKTEMGHGHDVWEGWVTGPFNSITSWSVRNANGLSLGMFVSNGNLTSSTIDAMVHPTAISTEMDGSNGHLEAIVSDRLRFVCPVPPRTQRTPTGMGCQMLGRHSMA